MSTHDFAAGDPRQPVLASDVLEDVLADLKMQSGRKGKPYGIPSGFRDLDSMTGGFHPEQLTVIGGRCSMGKTGLALDIVHHVATEHKIPILYFSLEMSKEQLVSRLLRSMAEIDSGKFRFDGATNAEWNRLSMAAGKLKAAPLFIVDFSATTVDEICGKVASLNAKGNGPMLVVVDYVQMMGGKYEIFDNLSDTLRHLKMAAVELEIPIVALTQLPREIENREDKRPRLIDLGDCTDADVVLFVYRDEYYDHATERSGLAEVIVAKQRFGPVGTVELSFESSCGRFRDKQIKMVRN